jgi:GntR family transcriptional regulator / MocR family aminotransferase
LSNQLLLAPWLMALKTQTAGQHVGYQALERYLRQCIVGGQLTAGTRLPTSRALAAQLGMGRNGVVDAYASLTHEGLLLASGRLGTVVASGADAPARKARVDLLPLLRQRLQAAQNSAPSHVHSSALKLDWRLGQTNTDLFPVEVWRAACKEAGRHVPPLDYGDPQGDAQLRQSLSVWLQAKRSLTVAAQQIVVTAGAGQAMDLLARVLVKPGDLCAVEVPGYPRIVQALGHQSARLLRIPVDAEGARVDDLLEHSEFPSLIHLTAAHQYPMGGRMSAARRTALLQAVRQHGSLIIENEYDHEFVHEGQRFAPLAASAPEHCIVVGTFARAISPALRLGFIVASPDIVKAVAQLIAQEQLQASWPVQMSAYWLLKSGQLERHLRRVGKRYTAMRAQLKEQLKPLAPRIKLRGDEGGLHVALDCSAMPAADYRSLCQYLEQRGMLFDSIERYASSASQQQVILMGYAHWSDEVLDQSIRLLKSAAILSIDLQKINL